MRLFLSFSFRDEDRDLVNVVERLLASHSARIASSERLGGDNLVGEVKQRLLQSDALVALFTRRDLLVDGTWTTHQWAKDEYEYFCRHNKPALALVEDGVRVGGIARAEEIIHLDRRTLLPAPLALSEVLGRWRQEFAQRQGAPQAPLENPRSSGEQSQKRVRRKTTRRAAARKPKGVPRVFINYRRENAQGRAGRLADNLRLYLGEKNVFFDQDDITPGGEFVVESLHAVANSRILLTVIGRDWATVKDDFGSHRLAKPDDLVRLELTTALEHSLPIIPVLIDGAPIPREDQLPMELHTIIRRSAVEVRDTRWTYDIRYLAEKLAEQLAIEPRFVQEGRLR